MQRRRFCMTQTMFLYKYFFAFIIKEFILSSFNWQPILIQHYITVTIKKVWPRYTTGLLTHWYSSIPFSLPKCITTAFTFICSFFVFLTGTSNQPQRIHPLHRVMHISLRPDTPL
ncbi:hypothetical protein CTB91_01385 [Dickeya solani]|uniref:Uncharacterized protein n=1 Tax=Dickeya solani D s0432-1 TaxID=1231725 RepID=A0AAV3KCG3_9GAMM|nr:hypothetical protein CTB91_01385 [Dickeya solani]ERO58183.1 hypothetical protein A544_1358 [Dickeya solani D s0432-1]AYQ51373.1 hypothetical protein DSOL99_01391 [Dickeya solani]MBD3606606.1 hypothetical protein [Dickeya solani]NUA39375.1 hypothetical protein [Dickeya solani]